MGGRRIDALYCSQSTAGDKIRGMIQDVQSRATRAKQEVCDSISMRMDALKQREMQLLSSIDKMAREKVRALEAQLPMIENGTCPPAPSEDANQAPDPNAFLLGADAIISYRFGDEDILEKIQNFGIIGEASTYASRSYAKGPALGILKVNNVSYVWVYACDLSGSRRQEGGDVVTAEFCTPDVFDRVQVEDLKDGRYKVTFVPLQHGTYTLRLTVGSSDGVGEDVAGSPFSLEVRSPTDYASIGTPDAPEGKAKIGDVSSQPNAVGSMYHPSGLDFDHTGKYLFVADQSNHRVQVFDSQEQVPVHAFGEKGIGSSQFDTPYDIVADRDNRLVVSDLLNHRLQVLEWSSRTHELRPYLALGGPGGRPGMFQFPKGLALTEQGHCLVADSGNHRVQVFDMADGFSFVREFGSYGAGDGLFSSPLDVAVNCQGEILVSDSSNRIQVFDGQGNFLRSFGSKGRKDGMFNYPTNMAVNDENALFVCDQGNHRVQVLDASNGSFLHKWGGCKNKAAEGEEGEALARRRGRCRRRCTEAASLDWPASARRRCRERQWHSGYLGLRGQPAI